MKNTIFSILSTSIIAFAIHKNIKIDTRHLFNHYDKNYEYTKALYDDQVSILQPIFGTNKADSIFAKLLLPYKDMDPLELIQKRTEILPSDFSQLDLMIKYNQVLYQDD